MIRLEILGRLVKEGELVMSKEGKSIYKFTLAVNEGKEKTSFHDITAFGKTAETIANHVKKGQMVFINDATLVNGKYENKEGNTIYTKEIIAFGFKFC